MCERSEVILSNLKGSPKPLLHRNVETKRVLAALLYQGEIWVQFINSIQKHKCAVQSSSHSPAPYDVSVLSQSIIQHSLETRVWLSAKTSYVIRPELKIHL